MKNNKLGAKSQKIWLILFSLIMAVLAIVISFSQFTLGSPNKEESHDTDFSTEIAIKHLDNIAKEPHPMGSEANVQVENYIVSYLKGLGMEVEIQERDASTIEDRYGIVEEHKGRLANIIGKIEGKSDKAIMLTAHYDSTADGPGAADDGYGVITLLEASRIMMTKEQPENTIYFVITDGEEEGMLGACALVENEENKEMLDNTQIIINMETRGNRGIPLLFETNSNNSKIIKLFKETVKNPIAYSFSYDIYKLLQNNTDFTVYKKEAGKQGFNFANIDGAETYHKPSDNIQNISKETIEGFGMYVLPLLTKIAYMDSEELVSLSENKDGDLVCFTLAKNCFIEYSNKNVIPIALIIVILMGALLYQYLINNIIDIKELLISSLMLLGFAILNLIFIFICLRVLKVIFKFDIIQYMYIYDAQNRQAIMLFLLVLMMVFTYCTVNQILKIFDTKQVILSSVLIWVLITCFSSFLLKGASYLFAIPTIIFEITMIVFLKKESVIKKGVAKFIFMALWVMVTLEVMAPFIYLIYISMTVGSAPIISIFIFMVISMFILGIRLMSSLDEV